MALDGIGDADPADQQRGEPDQREILREALDILFKRGRGVGAAADFPAGFRQAGAGFGNHGRHRRFGRVVVGQPHAIMPAHEAARLQQLAGAQRLDADQEPWAEADAAGELVGLRRERGADFDRGRADGDARARLEVEARQQGRIGGGAVGAIALRERIRQRLGRVEADGPEQRIGGVDCLDLDQRGAFVLRARHGAHGGGSGDAALRIEERAFGRGHFAMTEIERQVATKNHAALARNPVGEARRHRTDSGNGHDAERDAGDEHVEAARAGAQFAQGEAQRQPAGGSGELGEGHAVTSGVVGVRARTHRASLRSVARSESADHPIATTSRTSRQAELGP